MNKYLMMSAAALVAASAASTADAHKATSPTAITLSPFCDGINLTWSGTVYAGTHLFSACGYTATDIGPGVEGKKNVVIGDSYYHAINGYQEGWYVGLPLKTGGTWAIYATTNGTSTFVLNSGTYTVGYTPSRSGAPSASMSPKAKENAAKFLASRK